MPRESDALSWLIHVFVGVVDVVCLCHAVPPGCPAPWPAAAPALACRPHRSCPVSPPPSLAARA
eukprot:2300168-Lingulodinium_polyedra.AAC.1